jgi:hypothetical protein
MDVESLVTQILLLCSAAAVAIYSFTTFVQCARDKRDRPEIQVTDVSVQQAENQILNTRQSVQKFYTPRQKHLQVLFEHI